MKVNLQKSKVMVSGGITMDGLSKIKVDQCGFCDIRVKKSNSILCIWCDK